MDRAGKILLFGAGVLFGANYFRNELKSVPVVGYVVKKLPTVESVVPTAFYITMLEPIVAKVIDLGEEIGKKTIVVDLSKTLSIALNIYTHTNKTAEHKHSMGDFYAHAGKTICKAIIKTAAPGCGYLDLYVCETFGESLSLMEKDRKTRMPVTQAPSGYFEGWCGYIVSDSLDFYRFYVNNFDGAMIVRSLMAIPTKVGPVKFMSESYETYGLRGWLESFSNVPVITPVITNFLNTWGITSAIQVVKGGIDDLCVSSMKAIKTEPDVVSNIVAFGTLVACAAFGPSALYCMAVAVASKAITATGLIEDSGVLPLTGDAPCFGHEEVIG
jgi:hypothetical protein